MVSCCQRLLERCLKKGKSMIYLEEAPSIGLWACLRAPSRDFAVLLVLGCCLLLPATLFEVDLDPEEVVVPFIVDTVNVYSEK